MRFELRNYQKVGREALKANKRFLLFDEQGTGKTCQALDAISQLGEPEEKFNSLIVCKASLVLMWVDFIKQWFGDDTCVVEIKNAKTAVTLFGKYRFVVVSNNYIRKNWLRVSKVKWHVIVVDEYQDFMTPTSQQYKGLKNIVKVSNAYMWLMTGTIIKSKGEQYWSALNFCLPKEFPNIWKFKNAYCVKKRNWFTGGFDYLGIRDDKIPVIRDTFKRIGLRRKLRDVLPELPPATFQDIHIEAKYKMTGEEKSDFLELGLAKVEASAEFIASIGRPVVAFCWNVEVCRELAEAVEGYGLRVGIINGEYNRSEQHMNKTAFQEGKLDVLIVNHETGGSGLTLTAAADMVHVQFPWSPADYWQACSRILRIGQEANCVRYYNMLVKGSSDDRQIAILQDRSEWMKGVMNEERVGAI